MLFLLTAPQKIPRLAGPVGFPERFAMQMVSCQSLIACWTDILPTPFFVGIGIFAFEGIGQIDCAEASLEIGLVKGLDMAQMLM